MTDKEAADELAKVFVDSLKDILTEMLEKRLSLSIEVALKAIKDKK